MVDHTCGARGHRWNADLGIILCLFSYYHTALQILPIVISLSLALCVCIVFHKWKNLPIWILTFPVKWHKSSFLLLDLHFQHKIVAFYFICEHLVNGWDRAQILLLLWHWKSCICHRMAPLQMCISWPGPTFFNVMNFEMWISWKWWVLEKNTQ